MVEVYGRSQQISTTEDIRFGGLGMLWQLVDQYGVSSLEPSSFTTSQVERFQSLIDTAPTN